MMLSSFKRTAAIAGVALIAGFFSADIFAQTQTIASMGSGWKTQIQAILGIAKLVLGLVGFFFFAAGLFYFYKDNKQPGQGHVKTGVVALLVGTGLMCIPFLLGMFTESLATGQGAEARKVTAGDI